LHGPRFVATGNGKTPTTSSIVIGYWAIPAFMAGVIFNVW
jgi:hypothetical protein